MEYLLVVSILLVVFENETTICFGKKTFFRAKDSIPLGEAVFHFQNCFACFSTRLKKYFARISF